MSSVHQFYHILCHAWDLQKVVATLKIPATTDKTKYALRLNKKWVLFYAEIIFKENCFFSFHYEQEFGHFW